MDDLKSYVLRLFHYCKERDWAGIDPYDALNSGLFARTPLRKSRTCRIALTQIMKRLPLNVRPLLLIRREQNPKSMALFLRSALKLGRLGVLEDDAIAGSIIRRLIAMRYPHTDYWCWGYNFPWQGRSVLVPKWSPNLVSTYFVADALLDAFESEHESRYLEMAASAANYMHNELYWADSQAAGFSYPTKETRSTVHNANFLGAALLCRVYKHTGEERLRDAAFQVARFSAGKQRENGSWTYGEGPKQNWIDNFHTGYNLCALRSIRDSTGITEFEGRVRSGFEFYLNHFFMEDAAPRYFHNRTYPIDGHCIAQSLITLVELRDLNPDSIRLANRVLQWAFLHMYDERGFFYYQAHSFYRIKISYMRWVQAWMLLALSTLLEQTAPTASIFSSSEICDGNLLLTPGR